MTQDIHQQRADYGVDAPTVVRNNALIGSAVADVGTALYLGFRSTRPQLAGISLSIGLWFGFWFLVTAAVML
jgi:hypothetical protein